MKRQDLIKRLEEMGCILIRHGGAHDWYINPQTSKSQPASQHSEIKENLAKSIIKKLADL